MILFLNGKLVPEEQAVVSVLDRGFLYGDGLFEAIRVANRKPFRWAAHLERLARGAEFLNIRLPFSQEDLQDAASRLIEANGAREAILRIVLSRGIGQRGYSAKGADKPTTVMSTHPLPALDAHNPLQWRLATTSYSVHDGDPLSQFKTCNKLPQVLARTEAEGFDADEGLLLSDAGTVAEAASGNIFWLERGTVCSPPLRTGALPGVTRAIVLELCERLKIPALETEVFPEQLTGLQGAFVSLSSWGIVEASHLDGRQLQTSSITAKLRTAYQEMLQAETTA